jgi:cell division protein FtsA
MPKQKSIACIEFGSSRITVLLAARGVNDTINILGRGECDYDGYMDGKFIEPDAVPAAVKKVIAEAEQASGITISKLYVGVPADFSVVTVKDVVITLPSRQKITAETVAQLFDAGNTFGDTTVYSLINRSPVYFSTDDNRKTMEPFALSASRLGGKISYIFAERAFLDFVTGVLDQTHIAAAEFISTPLSEVLYLFKPEERESAVLLADIGHISSSVIVARGDAVLHMNAFSRGGGYISMGFMQGFGADYQTAEALKRKVVLTLNAGDNDKYDVVIKDKHKSFSAAQANSMINDFLKELSGLIDKSLIAYSNELPEHLPLYVTGGGVSHLRGAKDIMSGHLKRPVEIVTAPQALVNKPENSQVLGLADMALNQEPDISPVGFWERLRGIWKKK